MSLTSADMIRRRFGDHRPGLQLISVVDAALPVTMLRVDVLAQERKPLPLLESSSCGSCTQASGRSMRSPRFLVCSATRSSPRLPTRSARTTSRRSGQGSASDAGLEAARNLAAVQPVL